ncbi:uracil-DNA glycosylase family protein [Lacticaseibacillus thailandensis]|nr:uracil-DNA glycosylase family protein [Lacticaseibacillus thailandensis]
MRADTRQRTPQEQLRAAIMADPQNAAYTAAGIAPLYVAHPEARILLISQAPGRQAQDTRLFFNDPSGDRLRTWMDVTRDQFYDPHNFAVLPLDFYFPGKGQGGDLPPRKGFADKWLPQLMAQLPAVQLTVLIGSYAQQWYLGQRAQRTLTATVAHYADYLPDVLPIVHPSPRNQAWVKHHPWFSTQVLPELRNRVHMVID